MSNLRRLLRRGRTAESGFTLIELLVAMGLFTIFISVFLASVVALIRGTSQAKITAETSSKALVVFQNIDRQVRYADAINAPGDGLSGARYIEYRLPAESAADGKTTCYQWRFVPSTGQIQTRYWFDLPGATATPWATKLTSAQAPAVPDANYPFELIPASPSGSAKQQFVLTINAGNPGYDAKADVTSTFVARNSSQSSPNSVCLSTGARP
jgi:prepilin-type N-terminal cleavage/methylation domain-containing protein